MRPEKNIREAVKQVHIWKVETNKTMKQYKYKPFSVQSRSGNVQTAY